MTEPKRILALDPATSCGFAHSNGECGTWKLRESQAEHVGHLALRLRDRLDAARKMWGVDLIAFEEASIGGTSMVTKAFHNQLRGIVVMCAAQWQVRWLAINPATLKKFATGNGRADKTQVMRACRTFFGFTPSTSDEADARFVLEMARQNYQPNPTRKNRKPRRKRTKENHLF